MTNANTHGWEILTPHDIELIWDGVKDSSPDHVNILKGQYLENGMPFLETNTGNGTVTFDFRAIFETDPDHYLLFLPPANLFIDGVAPMSALLRSDWYRNTPFQYSWMMTGADKVITIPKGTPIALIINYPKSLLETTELTIQKATPDEIEVVHKYGRARQEYYKDNPDFNWTHWYRDGKSGPNSNPVYEKPYKPLPSTPRYLDEQ